MVDYSKWSNINDDSDDDNVNNRDQSPKQVIKYLQTILFQCDELLNKAIDNKKRIENTSNSDSNDIIYDFIIALKQYDKLYDKTIDVRNVENSIKTESLKLEIIITLNTVTCFTMINDWDNAILRCNKMFNNNDYNKLMSDEQILRARYFRSFSFYSKGVEDDLVNATNDAKVILKIIKSNNNIISKENKLEYQSFLEKLFMKCQTNVTSQQLRDILFQENNKQYNFNIDTGMALLKSGKKEEAYTYFKSLIGNVREFPPEQLLDLYQAHALTAYSLNKIEEAAHAYESAGNCITNTINKGSLYLQAAALRYKIKDYENAVNSYKLVIETVSKKGAIENNNLTLDDPDDNQKSSELIVSIAKAGLGASLVAVENYNDALQHLLEVTDFFENILLTAIKFDCSEGDFIKVFNNALSKIQHALNAIESIVDAYLGLEIYVEAVNSIKRGVGIISDLLTWTERKIRSENVKLTDEVKSQIRILKKRKATLLLKQGHALHNDPNIHVYDPIAYNEELEKIALVWEEAAVEFSFLKDHEKSLSTYKFIANMWMNAADIKPYHIDLNANKELADKAYEAWSSVAKEATLFVEENIKVNNDKSIIFKIQKQIMMALYYSAISALYYNNDVARYSFELCKLSADKYRGTLEELFTDDRSLEVEKLDFTLFVGDLSYHLAYAFFRDGKFEYAKTEIQASISFFINGQDRKKQKNAFGLAALTYSGQGLFDDADKCILLIKNLCLPPMEDPDEEVKELVKIIESEKLSSNKGDIAKFPILPSSTTNYKLEASQISWITLFLRNLKLKNAFYNANGKLDIIMVFSASIFIITTSYYIYAKIIPSAINNTHNSKNEL
jgi:tetratricopeptide (TPR) repeat protein